MKLKVIILILFSITSFLSCNKNSEYNVLPNVRVDIYAYLSQPEYFPLNVVGGWMYVEGGSKGIILYRKNLDEFMAYERHVPYKSDQSCSRAIVDSTSLEIIELCDSSKFLINNGGVLEGPASIALRQYNTSFDGDLLRVFN